MGHTNSLAAGSDRADTPPRLHGQPLVCVSKEICGLQTGSSW